MGQKAGSGTGITFSEEEEETCLEEFWKERHWVGEREELSTAPPLGFGNGNGEIGLRICVVLAHLRNLVG
jgi:hypothetical protein